MSVWERSEIWRYNMAQHLMPRLLVHRRIELIRHLPRDLSGPSQRPRRLFVDLAVISKHDAGTGIQRVVRALARLLVVAQHQEWDVQFVSATRSLPYHLISWPDPSPGLDQGPLDVRSGDVFLGLDYSLDTIRWHRRQLALMRRKGVRMWFLVHDLLPDQRPQWFSRNTVIRYRTWLEIIASLADGFFCNSSETREDLRESMRRMRLEGAHEMHVLPMGFDIPMNAVADGSGSNPGPVEESRSAEAFSLPGKAILMVGTVEPRKGHADIIRAFERLWVKGSDSHLVIVGRVGWHVEDLQALIYDHPEFGVRLHWFDNVTDPQLVQAYQACEGVIVASHAEGFGLPLIEALGYLKPVLARDLPVFRRHEGCGVHYFGADAGDVDRAAAIEEWIVRIRAGAIKVRQPEGDWNEATRLLLRALAADRNSISSERRSLPLAATAHRQDG